MARRVTACGICESINSPSVCPACVNARLIEKYKLLKKLSQYHNSLRKRIDALLKAKGEADEQHNWKVAHAEHTARLRERLCDTENELLEGKAKLEEMQSDFNSRSSFLAAASEQLAKKQVEQLGQFYPDLVRTHILGHRTVASELYHKRRMVVRQLCKSFLLQCTVRQETSDNVPYWSLCGARLPLGGDPLSVPATELAASLGYMLQVLNLAARYLSAPLLHSAGFAASSSRIWVRASYWNARPASRSEEFQLFIPQQSCGLADENIISEMGTSYVKFSKLESLGKERLDGSSMGGSRHGSCSLTNSEAVKDVQKGLKLLKSSVGCLTAYGFSLLSLPVPSNMSTFEAFAELMALLSAKDVRTRSNNSHQQQNNHSIAESRLSLASTMEETRYRGLKSSSKETMNSFLYIGGEYDQSEGLENDGENVFDEWDMVEHPTLPPPPSHSEDVEHWTRAMIIDVTK